jgi:hypothetical protein
MLRTLLIGAALALVASGCGDETKGPAPREGSASLNVEHVVDGSEGLYVEGSVWHLRVFDSAGHAVFDRKLLDEEASVRLAAGRYRIESEELPCDGNCSLLDPGTDGCSSELDVEDGGDVAATVTLRPGHGCKIHF